MSTTTNTGAASLSDERINELAMLNLGYDRAIRPVDFARAIEREVLARAAGRAQEPVAWLVEWKKQFSDETWVHAHASEPIARDQARANGGTCTPLYAAPLPREAATGDREFHEAAVKLVRDMMNLIPSFSAPSDILARINALVTAPLPGAAPAASNGEQK